MAKHTFDQIKEMAELLDMSMRCFWHDKTKEVFSVPDATQMPMDLGDWDDDLEKLETHFDEYQEIEPMDSTESFKIMEDFLDTIPDSDRIKQQLVYALNGRKPFRNFKQVIHETDYYRQEWFAFKEQKMQDWMRSQVERFV
jgi:hypothetical protein